MAQKPTMTCKWWACYLHYFCCHCCCYNNPNKHFVACMNCPKNSSSSGVLLVVVVPEFLYFAETFFVACLELFGIIYLGTLSIRKSEFHSLVRNELTLFDHVLCKKRNWRKNNVKTKEFFSHTTYSAFLKNVNKHTKLWRHKHVHWFYDKKLQFWIGWLDPVNFTISTAGIIAKSVCIFVYSSYKLPYKRTNKHSRSLIVYHFDWRGCWKPAPRKYLIDWCGFLVHVCSLKKVTPFKREAMNFKTSPTK